MGFASVMLALLARGAFYEKLIHRMEKKGMFGEYYEGFYIPSEADTPEGRKHVRDGYRREGFGCYLAQGGGGVPCGDIPCAKCIGCLNWGDKKRKREVFKEYDRRYPVRGTMPELKPGMIVHTSKGGYYLVVVGRKDDVVAYRCSLDLCSLFISDAVSLQAEDPDIDAVYDERDLHWFMPDVIVDILRGSERHRIWKRPDPAKEMTVDDISKALGYKVKVVGSEKADD